LQVSSIQIARHPMTLHEARARGVPNTLAGYLGLGFEGAGPGHSLRCSGYFSFEFSAYTSAAASVVCCPRGTTRPAPNQLWLTDITEHPTREGKLYCCVVLDTHSRKVIGWSIDST
jgi:transposase InsO family protein